MHKPATGETRRLWVLGAALLAFSAVIGGAGLWRLFSWLRPDTDGSWDLPSAAGPLALMLSGLAVGLVGLFLLGRSLRSARRTPATFLTAEEEERLLAAIRRFEERTSGEIRVHLAHRVRGDVAVEARRTFERLGMTATERRNGVLFFVAVASRRLAIIGDEGIDARVPEGFWEDCLELIRRRFTEGRYADGLVEGIERAGEALAEYFPIQPGDINELPDTISRD